MLILYHIFVLSNKSIRYNRWLKRKKEKTVYTKERFIEINNIQNNMGLENIIDTKNIYFYENNIEGLDILYEDFKDKFIDNDFTKKKY